ncbi:cytochrome P450 [Aspergillus germanicus]
MQRAAELNVPGKSFPMLMESFPSSNPDAAQCYARRIVEEAPKHNLTRQEISSLSGNLFGAGSDTSSSTLVTFTLACCAFPETLPRAWEELDRVVGPHRSPAFEDESELVYVKAFVKEVLRWRSVAIIGGQPHAPIKDDRYNGWLIPKNTWVQGNVWAIHHHEREFPDPDRFNPNRYIKGSPDARPFPGEKGYMTFGWGRRFEKTQELDIFDYSNGLNMRPNPFKCRITPRSDEIRATIEREGLQALQDLAQYEGETKYRMSTFYATENL